MIDKRTYGDSCGIARALDVAGDRWALLIVRELLLGPKRFTGLRAGLPHVSPDVLAQRLRDLEANGIVTRRKLPPPASARVYELTERGAALEPVLLALGKWGSQVALPEHPPPLSPDALAVALLTMYDQAAAGPGEQSYHVALGEHGFRVRLADGELDLAREDGPAASTVLTIRTDPGTLAALIWHGVRPEDALTSGALTLEGDERELRPFLKLFSAV